METITTASELVTLKGGLVVSADALRMLWDLRGPGVRREAGRRTALQSACRPSDRLYREAIRAGLKARPPASFQYLQLAGHWFDGKPTERVEMGGLARPVSVEIINQVEGSSGGAG